jgi:hypothetical protein
MKIFQVPQREVPVQVLLEGGEELEGLFYAPTSSPSGGPGRLSERLNDEGEHFLPLVDAESAYLISKSMILTVRLLPGEAELEFQESDQAKECSVEMRLMGGLMLTGRLKFTMPVEKARILDYLNAAPPFIALLENGRILLVNRSFLVRIRDLDGAG